MESMGSMGSMGSTEGERCHCGETAMFSCADCSASACARHYCAGCGRCDQHCVCGYRFWVPFDF